MFQISMGLRNHQLTEGSFKAAMDGKVLKIYAGAVPADANASIDTATLLVVISNAGAGTGLSFAASPTDGILSKNTAEVWKGENVASGNPSFYRLTAGADGGGASQSEKRAQGSVGILNADLLLGKASLVSGEEQRVDSFFVGMPAQG